MVTEWIVPAIIATLSGSVLLAVVFAYLWVTERQAGLSRWALAWVFYTLRLVADLVEAWAMPDRPLLLALSQLFALIAGLLLLNGSLALMGRRVPRWPTYVGAIVAVWIMLTTAAEYGRGVVSAPVFLVLGVANILAGVAWIRSSEETGTWGRLAGALFIMWGLHKFDYPVLRTVAWFAPIGFLMSAALEFGVSVAVLVAYMERTRLRLLRSERRYATLFEGSSSVQLLLDPANGEIVDANHAAAAYYGWPRERLSEMRITDINTLTPEQVHAEMAKAASRSHGHFTFRHRHADGSITDVEVYSGPIEVDGRELLHSIVHDISRRVAAEKALRESEARYAMLFHGSHTAMLLVEPDGARILDANESAARLYGHTVERMKEMRIGDFTQDPPELVDAEIAEALSTAVQVRHYQHRRADGSVMLVEVSSTPIVFEGKALLYTIVSDVTERVEAQRALEEYRTHLEDLVDARTSELTQANLELEAATRAKDEFMASMSHELRTPLNSVIGFADILLGELPGSINEEQRRQIDMIGRSGRHLLSIVNDILDLARIEAGSVDVRPALVDVSRMVERLIEAIRPLTERGHVALECNMADDLVVETDERLLEQILWNVVGNAVKFAPDGNVWLEASRESENVRFTVRDNGKGMTPEQLGVAFDKFTRFSATESNGAGTGLGLSISYRLAEALGGTLSAESTYGEGSCFTLLLPPTCPVAGRRVDNAT